MVRRSSLALLCGLLLVVAPVAPASASAAAESSGTGAAEWEAEEPYVTAVYLSLFGRLPDDQGLDWWSWSIWNQTPRIEVANSITSSEEFRSRLISDSYDAYLLREPDSQGLRYWLGRMAAGWTIAQMEAGFIASGEYWDRSGGTPAGWVTTLYTDVLDRSPAPSEVAYWTGRLETGASRGVVAMGFLLSTEHLTSVVDGYFQWLLGRGLDPSGRSYWVSVLQAGGRDEAIIGGIVASAEYVGRVASRGLAIDVPAQAVAGQKLPVRVRFPTPASAAGTDVTGRVTISVDGDSGACSQRSCVVTRAGAHTVTATFAQLSVSAIVDVVPGPPARLTVEPSSATIAHDDALEYSTAVADVWGNAVTGAAVGLSVDGVPCAGATCGPFAPGDHVVRAQMGSLATTAELVVVPPGPPSHSLLMWGQIASPTPQPFSDRSDWESVSLNVSSALAIRSDGTLWGWLGIPGCNPSGLDEPVAEIQRIGHSTTWASVDAGAHVAAGVQDDGSLWDWAEGTCEPGTKPGPVRVGTSNDWTAASAGYDHAMAIRADGTLWGWGSNDQGQLGTGTTASSAEPVRVGTGADWAQVSAGDKYTLAIKRDGSLWAWGGNNYGRLGLGTVSTTAVPMRVGTASDWTQVDTGYQLSAGVRADGTLWTWGKTAAGLTDVAPELRRLTPTQIGQGTAWGRVSVGFMTGVAVAADGSAWAWGSSAYGLLGDGSTVFREELGPIPGSSGWSVPATGSFDAIALVSAAP